MARKKTKLGIKTSKYFTKTCDNCGKEYPSFFTHCPHCGTAWDEHPEEGYKTKNIKIVAKITEENFKEPVEKVLLIFSGDRGESWYKVNMKDKLEFYEAEVKDVPEGATLIYFIEVRLANGEVLKEKNQGKYYQYHVGISETPEEQNQSEKPVQKEEGSQKDFIRKEPETESIPENLKKSNQPYLKECPKCHSKIKKKYHVCPICGHKF